MTLTLDLSAWDPQALGSLSAWTPLGLCNLLDYLRIGSAGRPSRRSALRCAARSRKVRRGCR
jgi:hypothetical protein